MRALTEGNALIDSKTCTIASGKNKCIARRTIRATRKDLTAQWASGRLSDHASWIGHTWIGHTMNGHFCGQKATPFPHEKAAATLNPL